MLGGLIVSALALVAGCAAAENGWIAGTVSDTNPVPQGNPISGAAVSVVSGSQTTTSDAAGHFNLTVPDGSYTLKISKSGYVDKISDAVTVHGNQTTLQNFVLVKPTGNLSGTVTDSTDGTPIGNIFIDYYVGDNLVKAARTSDNGKYNLSDLPVGALTIHVNTFGAFFDDINDVLTTVTIKAGQTTTKDFQLPSPPIWVNVTVKETKGAGIFGATVKLGNSLNRVLGLDGIALFLIKPGAYTLEVSADGYDTVSKNVTIVKNNPDINVILKKTGTTIPGDVGSTNGTLAAGLLMLILIPVIVVVVIIVVVIMWLKKKKPVVAPAPWVPVPQAPWEPPRI